MATKTRFILNGQDVTPRDFRGLEILATFDGDSVQANITTSEVKFANTNESQPKVLIDEWFDTLPTEGMPLEVQIESESSSYGAFKGYLDFRTLRTLSDVEISCAIKQDNGLASLDERLRGITMELLEQKSYLTSTDYSYIPYVVENRKTLLEKVYLSAQLYTIIKTGVDEVHKILNIASDITTLGAPVAAINLAVSIANLIILIARLVDLLSEIQDSFFPPIRYHKGITLHRAIKKAVEYCGYTLDCGPAFESILTKVHLCPSKDDEVGETAPISPFSGKLKPGDFGYIASDLFTLTNQLFYTKVAIVGNTVILKPFNDPSWVQSASYTMTSTKIEQAFISNGSYSINYDELNSSRIIEYAPDDSDLWTLTKVGEQISVTTVSPVTVNDQRRVLLTGSEQIRIPYALCVRKSTVDDLLDKFLGAGDELKFIKDMIKEKFDSVASTLAVAFPPLADFTSILQGRDGCMKVENHFFSTPKIVYLEANGRIPASFYNVVGAKALNQDYHSYKSFVPGVRNPADLTDTNAKRIYTDVEIPMGIDDFNEIISNSYFNTGFGGIGKFTSVKWRSDKDRAFVDFYIQYPWAKNITETTI